MRFLPALLLSMTAAFATDVTGTWNFAVELGVGSGNPTFVFKQQGDKITGTYSGTLGEAPVTGKIENDKIEFSFQVNAGGQKLQAVYKGVVKNGNEMQGSVDYGEAGDGTFSAKKKE